MGGIKTHRSNRREPKLGGRRGEVPKSWSLPEVVWVDGGREYWVDNRGCTCNHVAMVPNDSVLYAATGCIALRARRLSRVVNRHYEHALRDAGLTPGQFSLLAAVAIKEPLSPSALARTLDLDKSTLSRNLRPLIQSKFLVCQVRNAGGQSVRITRRGREVLHRTLPAWKKAQVEVMALLGADVVSRLDGMIAATAKR